MIISPLLTSMIPLIILPGMITLRGRSGTLLSDRGRTAQYV